MAKLIELVEAAKILGISPEELNDMRSRSEIFGYRDGSSWKFKEEEINRVRDSKGLTGDAAPTAADDDASSEFDLDLSDDEVIDANSDFDIDLGDDDADVIALPQGDDSDSILVSEEELGKSDENTASTIIGEADELMMDESSVSKADSDALTGESGLELTLESSDINSPSDVLGDAGEKPATASDTANLGIGGSDLKVATDSGAIDLSEESGIDDGGPVEASDDVKSSSSGFGSAIDLGLDDDELVLGSGSGSDVTSGAGDSGINLANPADSGLSLEEPLELTAGGSSVESLELGEDEMLDDLDGDLIVDDDAGEADDFMLTPVEDGVDEESDSGSQVIALDSDEMISNDAVEMLGDVDEDPILEEAPDFGDAEDADKFGDKGATGVTPPVKTGGTDDAVYSVWNVLSLFFIVTLLGLTGVLMLDLVNNIWSWDSNFTFNSSIMDAVLGLMPG